MTLGFNFDMALHLPSSHSSSSSHHSLSSHHDSAAIGIHHQHDRLHLQHQNNNNHGYSSYPIKYEPCEQQQHMQQQHQHLTTTMSSSSPTTNSSPSSSSSSAAAAAVGASTGIRMIGAHDFLLHQQQISSNSIFDRDFYDSIDSSSIMNGNNQQQQLQHHQHQQSHHHHRMLSCGSSSDNNNNNPNGLSIESHDSDESEDDEALMGINLGRNLDDKLHQQQQHHHQLRALEKLSSLNSSNSNNNLDRKRPYPCKVCPSKFGSKMELEEHQNSHTGQKPFECEVCKSRFNRRSTLWNHKRIHSDAKPFVCTICNMQFKWKNSLKCHKEMHIRKNETPSIGDIDSDIRQLTYATAAKRKMLEMDGGDSLRSASSLTIFSAAPSTSTNINNGRNCSSNSSNESSSKNAGQRKRQKLSKKESNSSIKKELMETTTTTATSLTTAAAAAAAADAQQLNLLMNKAFGTQDFVDNNNQNNCNNNYQCLMSNQAMRKLTFGNLGGDFDNSFSSNNLMSRDFGADFNLDHSNLDLMNNPLWMQLWNNEQVESMNHFDLNSNRHQNPAASLFGGMDDPSKVLTSGIFDLKDTLGLPNNGNNANNNSSSAAANHINMLLPKQMINIDLNSLNSFHDSVNQQHSNLPGINHLGSATSFPDYSHDNNTSSLTSQFHLAQNGQSTTSSSSTPSSNGHQPNGHLNSDLTYHQPIDHALLLNTNHPNDYMLPLEYMTPTGNQSIYPSNDLPLSALTSSHDLLEHSPHPSTAARGMFYHSSSNLSDHHPGCISSQIPNVTASAVAAVQQMR